MNDLKFCINWLFERVVEFLNYNNVKIVIADKATFFDKNKDKIIRLNGIITGTKSGDTTIFISDPAIKKSDPVAVLIEEIFHEFFPDVNHKNLNPFLKFFLRGLNEKQKNILRGFIFKSKSGRKKYATPY